MMSGTDCGPYSILPRNRPWLSGAATAVPVLPGLVVVSVVGGVTLKVPKTVKGEPFPSMSPVWLTIRMVSPVVPATAGEAAASATSTPRHPARGARRCADIRGLLPWGIGDVAIASWAPVGRQHIPLRQAVAGFARWV